MSSEDPRDSFTREYEALRNEWTNAKAQHQNAHAEVVSSLRNLYSPDTRYRSVHGAIGRERAALDKLRDILAQMESALDRLDKAAG